MRYCALDLSPGPGIGRNMRGFPRQRARASLYRNEAGMRQGAEMPHWDFANILPSELLFQQDLMTEEDLKDNARTF